MTDSRPRVRSGYTPIADYAAIGNCKTLALVSRSGSIDWMCLPHFSGPSLFAALLDTDQGGCLSVSPHNALHSEQRYIDSTNVLETTFRCGGGVLRVTDFMTILPNGVSNAFNAEHELVRIVECTEGTVAFEAVYAPRPDY